MPPKRVLIVDDAVVVRKMVSEVLAGDPELEVAGTAPNGRIGLAKIPQVNPDLVLLDIEMPEMNGLETLAALRKSYPRLPVIMFSTLTQRGAATTLDALALGANDYVTKPANVGSVTLAIQRVRDELIPRIKHLCGVTVASGPPPVVTFKKPPPVASPTTLVQPVELVVIGVSTGGPNALAVVIPALPADLSVPVLTVQHMPPVFTRLLAERLTAQSHVTVREAKAGAVPEPGEVWLAPGDYHMTVAGRGAARHLELSQGPPENSCRPAVDVLFRSAAVNAGANCLAVILTGMGQDGLRGCVAIREAGGQVLAQDEATSVVWGMPGYVAKAGLAEQVLPLDRIAPEIVRRVARGWAAAAVARA
jgi:two-component system, chemotaxis family, protein-glutamate methylesterase/glutaminase